MIYNLFNHYGYYPHITNLFKYITFRSGLAMALSLTLSLILGPYIISMLKKFQKLGQPIRDDGPESHKAKIGTPTMGGLMILGTSLFSILLFADLSNSLVQAGIVAMIGFGSIGFVDDYLKVKKYNVKGVRGKLKLFLQFLVTTLVYIIFYMYIGQKAHILTFPFLKSFIIDLGLLYLPFMYIVVIGSSNAVNLTDGLDGLAIVPVAITASCFGIISYMVGNSIFSNYLHIMHIQGAGEIAVICSSIVGSSLGFLWYNARPAEVFMGDTGSLGLGGLLGAISVMSKNEILLAIIGGIFVLEALSVILQVYYFKLTKGKRIFRMAPLHHHFEQLGWPETKVVVRFWIMSVVFAIIGLISLKIR